MGLIIQMTGMSGAGKTTLANALVQQLPYLKINVIDGDEYRKTLCADLSFSRADRIENIRRLGELAISLIPNFDVIIIAAINPYHEGRQMLVGKFGNAFLMYLKCEIQVLIKRDTKGLYNRSLLPEGHPDKVSNLTGINDIYEEPNNAALEIDTSNLSFEEALAVFKAFTLKVVNLVNS